MRVAMIGWRGWTVDTPEGEQVISMGRVLVSQGDEIITGNAPGFDQCAAAGGSVVKPGKVHLHLPWANFERQATVSGNKIYSKPSESALAFAPTLWDKYAESLGLHLPWVDMRPAVRNLMARNVDIILESQRVIAAPSPERTGGTMFGIYLAKHYGKPLFEVNFASVAPKWDICNRCGFPSNRFDCGAPFHSLKGYV